MSGYSGFFVGQIGAVIRLDTQDDPIYLAAATKKEIHFKRPDGVRGKWTAELSGTKLVYTTVAATDLILAGDYTLQAYLEGTDWSLHGSKVTMTIEDPV